jgi:hypothetical protein
VSETKSKATPGNTPLEVSQKVLRQLEDYPSNWREIRIMRNGDVEYIARVYEAGSDEYEAVLVSNL